MPDRDELLRRSYRRIEPTKSVDSEDSELAYQLHFSRLTDPVVIDMLVKCHTDAVYKIIFILLYYQKSVDPPKETILDQLLTVYKYAIKHVDQFHGNEGVLDWLLSITHRLVGTHRGKSWTGTNFALGQGNNETSSTDISVQSGYHRPDNISPKHRAIFLLRYMFGLSLHDISIILNQQIRKVHSDLKVIRKQQGSASTSMHFTGNLDEYIDGLLDGTPDELYRIKTHISGCEDCQVYATQLYEIEDRFIEELNGRWSFQSLDEDDFRYITQTIRNEIKDSKSWWKIRLPIKQTAWLLGLFILFIGLAIIFIGLTPVEREFPNNRPIDTTTSPSFVELPMRSQYHEPSRITPITDVREAMEVYLAEDRIVYNPENY